MTVKYTVGVCNCNLLCFVKTIFRWKGSLWKSIALESIIWCLIYAILSLIYRLALNENQRNTFEKFCHLFQQYGGLLPVTYMLGYFVTHVVTRWTEMLFKAIGWIDNVALLIASHVTGNTKQAYLYRKTMIRYLMIIQIMAFRIISPAMKRKFPTLDSLIDAGLLKNDERQHLKDAKFYIPCTWAIRLVEEARSENLIHSDNAVQQLLEFMLDFRKTSLTGVLYDYFSLPVCYLHIVYLCVRIFLIVSLLGRQITYASKYPVDIYVPLVTITQFIFLSGWCKVAESLLNPWGEDDDDFEINFIVDRNIRVGKKIVADAEIKYPPLIQDSFWNDSNAELLYSLETATVPQNPCVGSMANFNVTSSKSYVMKPQIQTVRQKVFNLTHIEAIANKLKYSQKRPSKEIKTRKMSTALEKDLPVRRNRNYSFPEEIRSETIAPAQLMDKKKQMSCPSLTKLAFETLSQPICASTDSVDSSRHVHWRNPAGDYSTQRSSTKKTINDVKIALRKCSSNLADQNSEDETVKMN